jgi:hypothetical protein
VTIGNFEGSRNDDSEESEPDSPLTESPPDSDDDDDDSQSSDSSDYRRRALSKISEVESVFEEDTPLYRFRPPKRLLPARN